MPDGRLANPDCSLRADRRCDPRMVGRVVVGTCHGGDMLLAGAMPDVFAASLRDISGFAKSLA